MGDLGKKLKYLPAGMSPFGIGSGPASPFGIGSGPTLPGGPVKNTIVGPVGTTPAEGEPGPVGTTGTVGGGSTGSYMLNIHVKVNEIEWGNVAVQVDKLEDLVHNLYIEAGQSGAIS
jgi:hypothetical protein